MKILNVICIVIWGFLFIGALFGFIEPTKFLYFLALITIVFRSVWRLIND